MIKSESNLYKIARYARYADVRGVAARKITDETVLAEIALKDSNHFVCVWAADRIKNEEILVNIIKKTSDESLSYRIVHKLSKEALKKVETDNSFIKEIAFYLLNS